MSIEGMRQLEGMTPSQSSSDIRIQETRKEITLTANNEANQIHVHTNLDGSVDVHVGRRTISLQCSASQQAGH